MKFRCERDVLVEALGSAGRAVAARAVSHQSLAGVHTEVRGDEVQLVGTDLDLRIEAHVTVAGIEDGAAVVPARLFSDIVRALEPGAVTVAVQGDDAHISSGRSQFAVRLLPGDDFPRPPAPSGDAVTLSAPALGEALRQVVRAASTDDALPVISGVLLAATESGGLRLVATDRYRLAVRDLPGTAVLGSGQKVLIPGRALAEVQRLLTGAEEVTVTVGDREAAFGTGGARLSTRLIDGEFPDYQKLIPSGYPNRLTVRKDTLLDAVRRVKLLVRDTITPVRVSMRDGGIECTVRSNEIGEATEDADAKFEGTELTMGFNPAYLIDGVEAVPGDEVLIETLDAMKPATVRPVDSGDYVYLLMPVRL